MKEELFDQYAVSLQFLSQALQEAPDEELLQALAEEDLLADFGQWECFAPCQGVDTKASVAALTEDMAGMPAKAMAKALRIDHETLFSGPEPKAAPWESVWREKDHLLFGECTEEVANFYLDWGIRIEQAGDEPEDHLGMELAFVLYLLQIMQETPELLAASGQSPQEALSDFLRGHVLLWAEECLRAASAAATTGFYTHIPLLCWALLCNLDSDLTASAD